MSQFTNQLGNIASPFFIEIVIRGTITRDVGDIVNAVTVLNFRRLTNSPVFDPTDIAAVFLTSWEATYKAIVAAEYKFNQYECRQMDDPTAATAINPTATVGTGVGDLYAPDTAVYMQLKTGFRGRSYFGSKHFGGAQESQIDKGLLTTGGRTAWDTVRTKLLSYTTTGLVDTAGNSWKLIVLSRVLSNLTASPAVFTGADVASILTNRRIGTMGRRRGVRSAF